MINIVIDTSIYRTDPKREKAAFRALNKLATHEFIKVHIPEIVEREFTTQQTLQIDVTTSDGNKFISTLKKRTPEHLHHEISSIESALLEIYSKAQTEQVNGLKNWAKNIGANIYAVQPHHGALVLDSYFKGSPPFSQPKDRKDFPDAFIYEAIIDLVKTQESLHVICQDENLRVCCAKISGVHTHSSLEDFLKSEHCAKAAQQLEHIENINKFNTHIDSYQDQLTQQLSYLLLEHLPYKQFEDSHFRSDDNSAAIEMMGEPQEIAFDKANIERLGPDTLLIPFTCELEALVYYPIFAGDYWAMVDNESIGIRASHSENYSDHYLEANEDVRLFIEGIFSISMKFNSDEKIENPDEDFSNYLETASFSIEEIDKIQVIDQ